MTEQHRGAPQGLHTRRSGSAVPDDHLRRSVETGESSTQGSLLEPTSTDRTLAFSDDEALPRSLPRDRHHGETKSTAREGRARRTPKTRPSGAFLLQDAVSGDGDHGHHQRRQSRKTPQHSKEIVDSRSSSTGRDAGSRLDSRLERRQAYITPEGSQEELLVRKRGRHSHEGSKSSTSPQRPSALDVDSNQIVNMALNLSESRRIASRRTVSRANPPRLTPLPDATPGSNLKTHLQQQRKTSRTISPRPHSSLTPRLPSQLRSNSPLQAAFDAGHDSTYRYHFSTSTLSRAQKVKEHLELMAQYRRLLEILPPLKPDQDRPGREYNPLQYIRNRKVRARERKAIDGERQIGRAHV